MFSRKTCLAASAFPARLIAVPGRAAAVAAVTLLVSSSLASALDKPVRPGGADAPPYVPNELLVKFKDGVAAHLQGQLDVGEPLAAIELSDSLDRLGAGYRVRRVTPIFKDFRAVKQRLQALEVEDRAALTETEQRLLSRRQRAPPNASMPALESIYKLELEPGVSVEAAVVDYGNDPSVEYAEPNYLFPLDLIPDDPYFNHQWALHNVGQPYAVPGGRTDTGTPDSDIDAPEAWEAYAPAEAVIVAIVDSGVDYNHPDLTSQMWTDGSGRYGYDFRNDDDDPMDDLGHGTLCAGIIAAGLNNGVGVSGLCPDARIMALKFAGSDGRGSAEDAASAIYYAANNGADIISNSYGYDAPSETLRAAIEYAYSQGVIIVASAGNESCAKPHYPATYEQVIAVASTTSNDRKRTSSSYGDWVDISAPGVDILSLRAADTDVYGDGEHIVGMDYYIASGTSMACPHVAGVAAMIMSHYPDLSCQAITARLLGTTDEIAGKNPTFGHLIGSGRLNANSALTDQEHPAIIFAEYDIQEHASGDGNGVWDPGETAHLTVVLKNIWADATEVHGTLWTSGDIVTIIDEVSAFGSIDSGQEADNEHDPFEITLALGISPYATSELSLTITAAGGYSRQLSLVATAKAQLQDGDWPKHSNGHEPIPYDIDGDGHIELVVRRHHTVEIVKPDGLVTAVLGGGEDYMAGIAVGDIQRDGHVEIVTWRSQGNTEYRYLCLWDKDGQQIYPPFYPNPAQWGGTPILYDLDGDGHLEIIIGGKTADGGEMVVRSISWQGAGLETQWQTFLKPLEGYYWITDIAVGDIDGTADGRPELVFGTGGSYLSDGGQLFALHSDGRIVQGWPVLLGYAGEQGPVLADLTGDGNLEIVLNTYDSESGGGLQVWDHAGALLWAGPGTGRSPVVADLDGDGDLEVLTPMNVYHHDGTDTGWSYHVVAGPHGCSVGDLDGDGDMEVLLAGRGLWVFHYQGGGFYGVPRAIDPSYPLLRTTPVLADLDRDGDIEVITSGGYLAVWDVYGNYDPANIEWSMYRHDPYRTGCYNPRFNLPPVWYAAPEDQVFVRGVWNGLYVHATDPERESIAYEVLGIPTGAQYEPEGDGLRFQWQPQGGDSGQEVTFWATDEDGERIAKTIHIAVVNILIDFDGDGDMDQKDYQRFCGCFLGPDEPIPVPICHQADFDEDSNVDLRDFAILQIEFGALSP